MDAVRYYAFLNTLQIEEVGPYMYRFQGSLGNGLLGGIFHYTMNAFLHLDPAASSLSPEDLKDVKKIVKEEIKEKEKL